MGLVGERASDRDALLLAAGKLRRPVVPALGKPERAEQLLGPRLGPAARQPEDELRQHDVLQRREFRQEVVKLIDEANLHPPDAGLLLVVQPHAIDAVDEHGAAVRPLQQAGDMQQRGFARAGGAKQSHGLARKERG